MTQVRIPIETRLRARLVVDPETGCHNWQGGKTHGGYGVISGVRTHRLAYELAKGPIPAGLHLDHLCRNPACCNPDHLEAVTSRENTLRGISPAAVAARRQTCARGHPYTEDNTALTKAGHRRCRTCKGAKPRKFYTAADRDRVLALRAEGLSYLKIQAVTGISRRAAWYIANGRAHIVEV